MSPPPALPAAPAAALPATAERRERVRARLADEGAGALVVTGLANVRYLSGFTGSAGVLLVFPEPPDRLVTDPRYDTQAGEQVDAGVEVEITTDPALAAVRRALADRGATAVRVESEHLTVAAWEDWKAAGGPEAAGARGWVEGLRAIKAPAELDAIREAGRIADAALADLLPGIAPGRTELEVAGALERALIERGAEGPAFETIVAFGERAALPHARPGRRPLARGEVVLIDFGAVVDGYRSDVTRTVALGDPGPEIRRAYALVLEGQRAALAGLRAGIDGRTADALARDSIAAAGLGERFGHSLGHGIGLEVHEAPRLSRKSEDVLAPGMVVTVEPGVYIPGLGGVRIEDDAWIGPDGVETLTAAPKDDLLVL